MEKQKTTQEIIQESLSRAAAYTTYREMAGELDIAGKTTGKEQKESFLTIS
jgi:hypothetical protein